MAPRHLVLVVLVGMVVVLVIHSLHTEATYRLDFLWKLQATGWYGAFDDGKACPHEG